MINNTLKKFNQIKNCRAKQKLAKKDAMRLNKLKMNITKLGVSFFKHKRKNISNFNKSKDKHVLNVQFNVGN